MSLFQFFIALNNGRCVADVSRYILGHAHDVKSKRVAHCEPSDVPILQRAQTKALRTSTSCPDPAVTQALESRSTALMVDAVKRHFQFACNPTGLTRLSIPGRVLHHHNLARDGYSVRETVYRGGKSGCTKVEVAGCGIVAMQGDCMGAVVVISSANCVRMHGNKATLLPQAYY